MSLIATRGLPFDHYAYPVNGIPSFKPIGPEVEPSVVYSIARQESAFNPAVVSLAQAYGLMQVTPDAGRYVCKRAGVSFDLNRMKTDSVYNAVRRGRLGRTDPLLRDAQRRAADHGEPAGLSRAARRRDQAPDRSRPASRRQRRIAGLR